MTDKTVSVPQLCRHCNEEIEPTLQASSKGWKHSESGSVGCRLEPPQAEPRRQLGPWLAQLKAVMRANGFTEKSLETVQAKDWLEYYRSDYTPEEAFREDMSYA